MPQAARFGGVNLSNDGLRPGARAATCVIAQACGNPDYTQAQPLAP